MRDELFSSYVVSIACKLGRKYFLNKVRLHSLSWASKTEESSATEWLLEIRESITVEKIILASSVASGPVNIGAGSVADFDTVLFEAIALAASRRLCSSAAERQLIFLGIVTFNGGTCLPPFTRGALFTRFFLDSCISVVFCRFVSSRLGLIAFSSCLTSRANSFESK